MNGLPFWNKSSGKEGIFIYEGEVAGGGILPRDRDEIAVYRHMDKWLIPQSVLHRMRRVLCMEQYGKKLDVA